MKIALGSDHAGFDLKEAIRAWLTVDGHEVLDLGCHTPERCDYPVPALAVARSVTSGEAERGVVICGSGIGVSIAANRVPGCRAALVHETLSARLCRTHNDANVLCLGARLIGPEMAREIVKTFLSTPFEGGRHQERVAMIDAAVLR